MARDQAGPGDPPGVSRQNPGTRYRELVDAYRRMHAEGEAFLGIPAKLTFPGMSLAHHLQAIKALIRTTGSQTILDYGAGKGLQYRPRRLSFAGESGEWESVADYWDVDNVVCYDPAYPRFSRMPDGPFDGVVSTDVLEHCDGQDLPWIVAEIFSCARRFVFLSVAGHPARKRLPNGENAHCTQKPLEWWTALVGEVSQRHPDVRWALRYYESADRFVERSGPVTDQNL